jgi:uncharacterized protein with HEPN domain
MKTSEVTDLEGCELVLELIDHVQRRIAGMSETDFVTDKDEIDLTAFRLSIIGETTNRFTKELKERYPQIPWPSIYGMRNIISHNYANLDPAAVWRVSEQFLGSLAKVCRQEVERQSGG